MKSKETKYKELLLTVLYAELGGHLNPGPVGKRVLDKIRNELSKNKDFPAY